MRNARTTVLVPLFIAVLILTIPLCSGAQNREKFVISARAGGVNAVTGGASLRAHGQTEWQQLTITEDLEAGDVVRTGLDGRVEMLLNPGSYLRVGEDSEFELADNSLENLEVRLLKGTAIVEVTGADDDDLFIGITTPHTRLSIVQRGLYRVNVVPGDTTELIVRKGRVMLEGSHTKVKGGNKVVFSSNTFSVAKLNKTDKETDPLDGWSKNRAQTLAKENSRISDRMLNTLANGFSRNWPYHGLRGGSGFWLFSARSNCYTFVPFFDYFGSPYGGFYSRSFFGGTRWGTAFYRRPIFTGGPSGSSSGATSVVGPASTGAPTSAMGHGKFEGGLRMKSARQQ